MTKGNTPMSKGWFAFVNNDDRQAADLPELLRRAPRADAGRDRSAS